MFTMKFGGLSRLDGSDYEVTGWKKPNPLSKAVYDTLCDTRKNFQINLVDRNSVFTVNSPKLNLLSCNSYGYSMPCQNSDLVNYSNLEFGVTTQAFAMEKKRNGLNMSGINIETPPKISDTQISHQMSGSTRFSGLISSFVNNTLNRLACISFPKFSTDLLSSLCKKVSLTVRQTQEPTRGTVLQNDFIPSRCGSILSRFSALVAEETAHDLFYGQDLHCLNLPESKPNHIKSNRVMAEACNTKNSVPSSIGTNETSQTIPAVENSTLKQISEDMGESLAGSLPVSAPTEADTQTWDRLKFADELPLVLPSGCVEEVEWCLSEVESNCSCQVSEQSCADCNDSAKGNSEIGLTHDLNSYRDNLGNYIRACSPPIQEVGVVDDRCKAVEVDDEDDEETESEEETEDDDDEEIDGKAFMLDEDDKETGIEITDDEDDDDDEYDEVDYPTHLHICTPVKEELKKKVPSSVCIRSSYDATTPTSLKTVCKSSFFISPSEIDSSSDDDDDDEDLETDGWSSNDDTDLTPLDESFCFNGLCLPANRSSFEAELCFQQDESDGVVQADFVSFENLSDDENGNDDVIFVDDCDSSSAEIGEDVRKTVATNLDAVNSRWNQYYRSTSIEMRQKQTENRKKVRFARDSSLFTTHIEDQLEADDYAAARKGPWEEYARDRDRFSRRIQEIGEQISWVFSPSHRNKVHPV